MAGWDRASAQTNSEADAEPDGPRQRQRADRRRTALIAVGAFVAGGVLGGVTVAGIGTEADRAGTLIGDCELGPGAQCPGADLSGATLQGLDLTGANLAGANLSGATISNSTFRNADLRGATMDRVIISDSRFTSTNLEKASLNGAYIVRSPFNGARLTNARIEGSHLRDWKMFDGTAAGVSFAGSTLENVEIDSTPMNDADLRNTSLRSVIIDGSSMQRANMTDARFLVGKNVLIADLTGANLTRASLTGVYGMSADKLSGAAFSSTTFPSGKVSSALDKGNLVYTGIDNTPTLGTVSGVGEGQPGGPSISISVYTGGTRLQVEVKAVFGCAAFGEKTKTFALLGMDQRVGFRETYSPADGVWERTIDVDPMYSERNIRWVGPSTFSNMCSGSYYAVRVRALDDAGNTSSWSNTVQVKLS